MKKRIFIGLLTMSVLFVAILSFANDSFLSFLSQTEKLYQEGNYLEARIALIKAAHSLDMTLAQSLKRGDIPFEKIRDVSSQLTDIQFNELKQALDGKKVKWSGYIVEVKEGGLGGYEVYIDVDLPENSSTYDISLWYSLFMKDFVTTLEKGKKIEFEGEISKMEKISDRLVITLIVNSE